MVLLLPWTLHFCLSIGHLGCLGRMDGVSDDYELEGDAVGPVDVGHVDIVYAWCYSAASGLTTDVPDEGAAHGLTARHEL